MTRPFDFTGSRHGGGTASAGDSAPLPFEAEFDGARRPQVTAADPCDPNRYWEIFSSGTD